jgi:hypothetical protein
MNSKHTHYYSNQVKQTIVWVTTALSSEIMQFTHKAEGSPASMALTWPNLTFTFDVKLFSHDNPTESWLL